MKSIGIYKKSIDGRTSRHILKDWFSHSNVSMLQASWGLFQTRMCGGGFEIESFKSIIVKRLGIHKNILEFIVDTVGRM